MPEQYPNLSTAMTRVHTCQLFLTELHPKCCNKCKCKCLSSGCTVHHDPSQLFRKKKTRSWPVIQRRCRVHLGPASALGLSRCFLSYLALPLLEPCSSLHLVATSPMKLISWRLNNIFVASRQPTPRSTEVSSTMTTTSSIRSTMARPRACSRRNIPDHGSPTAISLRESAQIRAIADFLHAGVTLPPVPEGSPEGRIA